MMTAIWAELHTFLIYAVFGYLLIYPLVLAGLRLFSVKDPGQRRLVFILALLMPFIGFVAYHTIFLKQCEGGHFPFGATSEYLHILCIISDLALKYTGPLIAVAVSAGLLKAVSAALLVKRLSKVAINPQPTVAERVSSILEQRAGELKIAVPALIYTDKKGFAAFTTGLVKPVIVLNNFLITALSNEELDFIISHELVHIQRRDNIKSWLINLLRDLVILNPISTMLLKNINYETERICDRKAARLTGLRKEEVAAILLKVWKKLAVYKPLPLGLSSSFSADRAAMENRVLTYIHNEEQPQAVSPMIIGFLLLFVLSFSLIYFGILC
jgi:beta-lactamase regulating signal transducer with metallopeptidase domain